MGNKVAGALAGMASLAMVASVGAQEFLRLATLGPGSSPYLVMSTFAQIVNDKVPEVEIQVNATGAATQHAIETANENLDFFMWSASVHDAMKKGANMYAQIPQAPELATDLRAVFSFPLGLYHITTYADSGIATLDDIEGKRVFLGPPGGGAAVIMQKIIEGATGYKPGEDYESVQLGWDAAAQAFQDGRIDVYINPTNSPSPVIQQMALSRDIRFLGLTPEQMEKPAVQAVLNRPGGVLGEIEAGTYGDNQVNEENVQTLGSIVGVGVGKHVAEETIYEITKAFWEGVEEAEANTPWLRRISLENALDDLNLPLHPGAARYYEEIGMEIPAEIRPTG
jgi:TRAP transporter TAXI family solute receptor